MMEAQSCRIVFTMSLPYGSATLHIALEGVERYRQDFPLSYLEGWFRGLVLGNPNAIRPIMDHGETLFHVHLPSLGAQEKGGDVDLFITPTEIPSFLQLVGGQLDALRNLPGGYPWTGETFCTSEDKAWVRQKWELPDGCKSEWCTFWQCPLWVDSESLSIHIYDDKVVPRNWLSG